MKILAVEDDVTVAHVLQDLLSSYHYAVDIATDGEAGLQMVEAFDYDLVLLDIILPRLDGISLCQTLRTKGLQTPILLLTARGEASQKAIALNAGADDYVVKPFDAEELIARVQALLRRGGSKTLPILRWGNLSVNPSSCSITYGAHLLSVTPKEYAILELFLRTPQTVLTPRAILDHAWSSVESPGDESVRTHIKDVRKKLKAVGAPSDLIKTVYGVGYQLNPLYAGSFTSQENKWTTVAPVTDLAVVNEDLSANLPANVIDVQSHQSDSLDLQVNSQASAIAHPSIESSIEQERQRLQTALDEGALAHGVADHALARKTQPLRIPLNAIVREPLVVSKDTTVMDAIAQMSGLRARCQTARTAERQLADIHLDARASCVLVVAEETVIGILTERDVVHLIAQQQPLDRLVVEQVMTQPVITLSESAFTDLFLATHLFQEHHIRHVIILDNEDRLVGLVTHESLRQISRPMSLLRLRLVSEVMTREVICATPDRPLLAIAQLMADHRVSSVVIVEPTNGSTDTPVIPIGILTEQDLVQFQALGLSLEIYTAEAVMSTPIFAVKPQEPLWTVQQIMDQRCIRRVVVTGEYGQLNGIVTQTSLLNILNPLDLSTLTEMLEKEVAQLEAEKIYLLENRTAELERQVVTRTASLKAKVERERLLAELTTQIQSSLNIQTILETTVEQVRRVLGCDRVNIWRFEADWQTIAVAESTASSPSLIGERVHDDCLQDYLELYRQGRIRVVTDIHTIDITDCHRDMLIGLHTRAKILVPLWCGDDLWGLLNATESQKARDWHPDEVELLQVLSRQLAIALQQATTHEQLQAELRTRQATEAYLQESEQRYASLLRAVPVGIFRTDAEGQCIYVNDRWCQIAGLTRDEAAGDGWIQGIHPGDRDQIATEWKRAAQENRSFQLEYRFQRPDGVVTWVYGQSVTEQDAHGHVTGYVGTITDISERKQLEAAKLQTEQTRQELTLLEQILDNVLAGYWDWDIPNHQEYLSPGFKRMFGYGNDELSNVPESWQTLIFSDDLPNVLENFNHHVQSHGTIPFYQEVRYHHQDGSTVWVICSGQVIDWDDEGNPLRMVGCHVDISAHKYAEQRIREQAALLDIAPAAIFVRDLDNRILFWSQGAERLYGWTATEALGKIAHELFGENADAELEIGLKTTLKKGSWQGELTQTTNDGARILVASRWTLMRDPSGQPQSLLVVNTDITEKKQLEAQFYQTQRMESLGRLASGIAHDLNNVLTPILTTAQLLRLTQESPDAKTQERLKILEGSAQRGADMVKQILTFTRGSSGEQIRVSLAPLLQEVISIVEQSIPKSIDIHSDIPESDSAESDSADGALSEVYADPTLLHQVFMNLCINARDAMPHGGTLTLSARNDVVDGDGADRNLDAHVGPYVAITIADTGTGIDPTVRDRIFEPFFTTKESGRGTGLGLSTVLGIVKDHGGFLNVSSDVGQGTQMTVYLPVIDPALAEHRHLDEQSPQEQLNGHGEGILIVDDDFDVQQITKDLLEDHHYRTFVANDGVEAIALFLTHQDDIKLVISDVMMPNIDGISLVQKLKETNPRVKIISISGLPANRLPVLTNGADAFLAKPYSLKTLLRIVYGYCQAHEQRSE